jgi:hypothetical protein
MRLSSFAVSDISTVGAASGSNENSDIIIGKRKRNNLGTA